MAAKFGENKVAFALCDVTKQDHIHAAWSSCEEKLGFPSLLINNAGICNEVDWRKTFDVNMMGTMQSCFYGLEKMSKEKGGEGGVVLNIASVAGLGPLTLCPTYTATKHGVVGITRVLGHRDISGKSGVNFLCLCPNLFESTFMAESLKTPFDPRSVKEAVKTAKTIKMLSIADVEAAALQLLFENRPGGVLALVDAEQGPYYVDCLEIATK